MDRYTNRSKGFGFVEMPDDVAARKAITELMVVWFEGRAQSNGKQDRKKKRLPSFFLKQPLVI